MATPIMGKSETNVLQMVQWFEDSGKEYPAIYGSYGAPSIIDFCNTLLYEAETEGVRAEVVFAQAMLETGWLQFGGDVKPEQCNFCGLGATGGVPGNSFDSVQMGLRAQIQHLKAYASTDDLENECIDQRFKYVTRGIAPNVEDLGGRWATSDTYGNRVVGMMEKLLTTDYAAPVEESGEVNHDSALEDFLAMFYKGIAKAVCDEMQRRMLN